MEGIVNFDKLKQSYQEQLVRAGVHPHKAEQAAETLTLEEFQLISEIWTEWATVVSQIECEAVVQQQ